MIFSNFIVEANRESGIRDFYISHHLRGRGENVYSTTIGETLELLARWKNVIAINPVRRSRCTSIRRDLLLYSRSNTT